MEGGKNQSSSRISGDLRERQALKALIAGTSNQSSRGLLRNMETAVHRQISEYISEQVCVCVSDADVIWEDVSSCALGVTQHTVSCVGVRLGIVSSLSAGDVAVNMTWRGGLI